MIRKIAFLGTPEISTHTLRSLVEAGYQVPLVVTGADKKRGRGATLTPSPVNKAASELGLPVSHDPSDLLNTDFDLAVVVAYGRIISDKLLQKGHFVNLHFSLLPRWRGAAPMERAILSGDSETGVCLMELVKDLDAGPIYRMQSLRIDIEVTLSELAMKLSKIADQVLLDELSLGAESFRHKDEQVGEPTYAHKVSSDDLRIDWTSSMEQCLRQVRLERAWTTLNGRRFKVLDASLSDFSQELLPGELNGIYVGTGRGCIELKKVQPENKQAMDAIAWINGLRRDTKALFI